VAKTEVKARVEQRAALIEQVLEILSPQLDRQPLVTVAQHIELQTAVAVFAERCEE
jgi:hypothetical protein